MESHVRFFATIGGVYREMVYDNMRVAVAKFVGRHEKESTRHCSSSGDATSLDITSATYTGGTRRGHVERSVEYVRRKAFAPGDTFVNVTEAQQWLENTLQRINAGKQQGIREVVHGRSYEKYSWNVDIKHYLTTFKRKPSVLAGSQALPAIITIKSFYVIYQ